MATSAFAPCDDSIRVNVVLGGDGGRFEEADGGFTVLDHCGEESFTAATVVDRRDDVAVLLDLTKGEQGGLLRAESEGAAVDVEDEWEGTLLVWLRWGCGVGGRGGEVEVEYLPWMMVCKCVGDVSDGGVRSL